MAKVQKSTDSSSSAEVVDRILDKGSSLSMRCIMISKKHFSLVIIIASVLVSINGCGGSSDHRENAPVSDSNNWVIEKVASVGESLNTISCDSTTGAVEYAFGDNGLITSRTGDKWTIQTSPENVNFEDSFMLSPKNMWVVGSRGTIAFFDGTSWTEQESKTLETLRGVSPLAKSEQVEDGFSLVRYAWAVGDNGTILHYNNTEWNPQASGTTKNLYSVSANDLTDDLTGTHAWAVGENGTILYYNGTNWIQQESGVTADLHDVKIAHTSLDMSEVSVFAVGDVGTILHYDGTSWTQMESGTTNNLYAVGALPDDSAMAVGANGTILFYNRTTWIAQNSGVENDLHELFMLTKGTNRGAVVVAIDGSIIANRPVDNGTVYFELTFISNDTDKGGDSAGTWVHVINAGEDFGNRNNWPYWATPTAGLIKGGWDPYWIPSGQSIYLAFSHDTYKAWVRKDLQFNVIYSYDYNWDTKVHSQLDQRYCFQLSGDTCSVGNGKDYVSNSPSGNYIGGYRTCQASTATKVAQRDYDFSDDFATRVCSWMGVDTSSTWGKLVKSAVKSGIAKLFGSGFHIVYKYYEVSFTNWWR